MLCIKRILLLKSGIVLIPIHCFRVVCQKGDLDAGILLVLTCLGDNRGALVFRHVFQIDAYLGDISAGNDRPVNLRFDVLRTIKTERGPFTVAVFLHGTGQNVAVHGIHPRDERFQIVVGCHDAAGRRDIAETFREKALEGLEPSSIHLVGEVLLDALWQ